MSQPALRRYVTLGELVEKDGEYSDEWTEVFKAADIEQRNKDLIEGLYDIWRNVSESYRLMAVTREDERDALKKRIQALDAALREVLKHAVILSEKYLSAFSNWPDDAAIQGWDKARWLRALIAKKQAEAALTPTPEQEKR